MVSVGVGEIPVLVAEGVVLHQPLKRPILVKNSDFRQNMNGIPVSLFRKTENAPTQRPQNGLFGTLDWALFSCFEYRDTEDVSNT